MLTAKPINRFCLFGVLALLFNACLFAADREVPTEYPAFLNAVNAPYAWNLGFTGKNVVVGIVDDSIEMDHPFFGSNIDTSLAYNTGVIYNDDRFKQYLPTMPTQSATDTSAIWDLVMVQIPGEDDVSFSRNDHHGTCVTGCIAAYDQETNTYGPAYGAILAPIRVDFVCQAFHAKNPDGTSVSAAAFSQALMLNNSSIDIKNNSYGTSTGFSDTDPELRVAGINDARANNTILLFASGNDRNKSINTNGKDCSKKVTTGHPYTIAVASTGNKNARDYTQYSNFSNYGSCVFIAAPGYRIQTADRDDVLTGNVFTYQCEYDSDFRYQGDDYGIMDASFNGTSAACPVATGVLALALDAYKTTYPGQVCDVRFIKHLLTRTSTKIDLEATNPKVQWTTNAAGLSFSHTYGFGQINAKGLIDAILDPETTLGGQFVSVTPQTIATINWSNMEVSPDERLVYHSTTHPGENDSSGSSLTTTFDTSVDYATLAEIQPLAADGDQLVYSEMKTITGDTFLNAGIAKQGLEEVVITMTVNSDDLETGFDARYMEIVLDHNGLQSYLAFSDTSSPKENLDDLTWSFSSNAFWGEDPTGDWTLSVYNVGTDETFRVSDVFSVFYMGALQALDPNAVPEPSAWVTLILGTAGLGLIYRQNRRSARKV